MCTRLWKAWPKILKAMAEQCEAENGYGVFRIEGTGIHLNEKRYASLIEREGLTSIWPRSATVRTYSRSVSKKKKDQPNLRTMAGQYPRFRPLFETVELLQNYKRFEPAIGPDGRWRAPNVPWNQKTGRVTPMGANLFRVHSWFRHLIKPLRGGLLPTLT